MTAREIIETVNELENASRNAISWMLPGGSCCNAPRAFGYCTAPGCVWRRENYGHMLAVEAAHAARKLMRLTGEFTPRRDGFTITREWLKAHATRDGVGWTRKQIEILGLPWPPPKGWLTRLWKNKTVISAETRRQFEAAGNQQTKPDGR